MVRAGGTEACKTVVFASKEDPDYQAILKTFEPLREILVERPRMDMIGREQPNKTGPIRKAAAERPPDSKVTSMFSFSPLALESACHKKFYFVLNIRHQKITEYSLFLPARLDSSDNIQKRLVLWRSQKKSQRFIVS
jgi:hypothetical protein